MTVSSLNFILSRSIFSIRPDHLFSPGLVKYSSIFALTCLLLLFVKVRGWEYILGSGTVSCLELRDTLKMMRFKILLLQSDWTSMDFLMLMMFQVLLLVLSCVHVLISK